MIKKTRTFLIKIIILTLIININSSNRTKEIIPKILSKNLKSIIVRVNKIEKNNIQKKKVCK